MTGLGQSILEEGIECGMERGIEYGMERGRENGMNMILQMNQRLLQEKRYADLERATSDKAFREHLFAELFPEDARK